MYELIMILGLLAAYPGTRYVECVSTQDSWVIGSNAICLHLDGKEHDYMLYDYRSKDVDYVLINNTTGAIERIGYGDNYVTLCEEICPEYDISPELMEALIETESSGWQSARNDSCYGICQINGDVWGYEYQNLYEQINFACQLLLSYDCEIDEALSHYNGQTHPHYDGYVEKVLTRAEELEREHNK